MANRGSFTGGKAAGRGADYSPPFSNEVKNAWNNTSTHPIRLAWCTVNAEGQL